MSIISKIIGKTSFQKSVPSIAFINELTREGRHKSFIPQYLYKPPYGYPRNIDLNYLRWLANTPYVKMCIYTILDEISSIPWDIIIKENHENKVSEEEIERIKNFFKNPNTTDESFVDTFITKTLKDTLEIGTGILVKVFNLKEEMVEVVARDGASFTKNPDIYGTYENRDDLILFKGSYDDSTKKQPYNLYMVMNSTESREKAAYFQYGWAQASYPVPYGRKEIVWIEKNKRTDNHYALSPIYSLATCLQMLLYSVDSDLEYYNDNNMPKGVLALLDSDGEEIKDFQKQWKEGQRVKDEFGNWKKKIHSIPIVGKMPEFKRIEFTSVEMQTIEKQKWYSKMVWACFGVTETELGYTIDAKGMSNQIVQSKVFRKRAVYPYLKLIEHAINNKILTEFENEHVEFKYLIYDTEEEKAKYDLYKVMVDSKIRTVNEIRNLEGLKEVEWGDKPVASSNPFNPDNNNQNQNMNDKEEQSEEDYNQKKKQSEEKTRTNAGYKSESKDIEDKACSFAGYSSMQDCVNKNRDKKNPGAYCMAIKQKVEKKALGIYNPLIPKEGEQMDEEKLKESIEYILDKTLEQLLQEVEKNTNNFQISNIKSKSMSDLIKRLEVLFNMEEIRKVSNTVIENTFYDGYNEVEMQLNRNLIPNKAAIEFLKNYTFNNIKDMSEELKNDLRQILQRGIMDGESSGELKTKIRDVFKMSGDRAEKIARTETNRAQNRSTLSAWQESGEKAYKWLDITYDGRTSEISKAMGNKYGSPDKAIPIDQDFSVRVGKKTISGPSPPFHVNERDKLMFITEHEKRIQEKAILDTKLELGKKEKEILEDNIRYEIEKKEPEVLIKKEKLLEKLEAEMNGTD